MQRKLDLRTGRPVWLASRAPKVETGKLTRDIRTDVLVVGMGISGAMLADELSANGHRVVMIDRRGPMLGSTPATTALVQFEVDQPLSRLALAIGREKAERAWRRSRLALANLAGLIRDEAIACRMEIRPSLYLAGNVLDRTGLEAEALARRQAGIRARFLKRSELKEAFGIDRPAAIMSDGNLTLDPRMLTGALLNRALARGARFYSPVEATRLHHAADGVTVETANGPSIRAAHVVLATGYELLDMVDAPRHSIISTWAIATRRQPAAIWPKSALIWEASDPYLYLRATSDGRVVCGGEDEPFADEEKRDSLIGRKTRTIAAKLKHLLPGLDTRPEFAWAGAFGSTETGLPYIGALPGKPRILAVLGYGGNGITYSRIAAELVSTSLAGREDSDTDLYAF